MVARVPNRGGIWRAFITAATAAFGLMAPAEARLAMSSMRPAASSCSDDRVDPSIW